MRQESLAFTTWCFIVVIFFQVHLKSKGSSAVLALIGRLLLEPLENTGEVAFDAIRLLRLYYLRVNWKQRVVDCHDRSET